MELLTEPNQYTITWANPLTNDNYSIFDIIKIAKTILQAQIKEKHTLDHKNLKPAFVSELHSNKKQLFLRFLTLKLLFIEHEK